MFLFQNFLFVTHGVKQKNLNKQTLIKKLPIYDHNIENGQNVILQSYVYLNLIRNFLTVEDPISRAQ